LSILIHYPYKKYKIIEWLKVKKLIRDIISQYGKKPGNINYIFIDNEEILKLNCQYLRHNYPTDVMCFILDDNNKISGDIYVGIETVIENSIIYNVSLENELMRVVVHGTLHLCGVEDSNDEEREIMKKNEDYWLEKAVSYYGIQL